MRLPPLALLALSPLPLLALAHAGDPPPPPAASHLAFAPQAKHVGSTVVPASPPASSDPDDARTLASALGTHVLRAKRQLVRRPAYAASAAPARAHAAAAGGALADPSEAGLGQAVLSAPPPADGQQWVDEEMDVPDLDDLPTLVNFAKMANDAYATPGEPRWMELERYNLSLPFGWDPESTADAGLRGHVFASADNATLVVSIKGTSIDGPVPPRGGGGGSTARLDQVNDNLFFSCCCGTLPASSCACKLPSVVSPREPFARPPPPLGRKRQPTCDAACAGATLVREPSYYPQAVALYADLRLHNPTATIWLTGHSLGGAVAALLGLTFGLPTVAFEAPPERLAVDRLGLGLPDEGDDEGEGWVNPVTNVFHTGDMIATGSCRGPLSACGRGGYAMESSCHQGQLRVYRTVEKWGWKVDRTGRSHTIQWAIDNVYSVPWNDGEKEGPDGRGRDWTDVPRPTREDPACVDCAGWTFV